MAKKKYKRGKKIESISDFEKSKCDYFIVYFGCTNPQTKHRAFLISWQYRTLLGFIENGFVFEAEKITNGKEECISEETGS
jgi:hypothetical protein